MQVAGFVVDGFAVDDAAYQITGIGKGGLVFFVEYFFRNDEFPSNGDDTITQTVHMW